MLKEPWRTVYGVNPMVGVVEGFRWAVLGHGNPPGSILIISSLAAVLVTLFGSLLFPPDGANFCGYRLNLKQTRGGIALAGRAAS